MYYLNDSKKNELITYLASASVDSTIRIWIRNSDFDLKTNHSNSFTHIRTQKNYYMK